MVQGFPNKYTQSPYPNFLGYLMFQGDPNPNTSWLLDDANFSFMEEQPIDGIFLPVNTNTGLNFSETIFGGTTYTGANVSTTLTNILTRNNRGWKNSINNWLYINTEPTQIDFENATHTNRLIANWLVAGQLVKDSQANGPGLIGIAFDNESYGAGKFQYSTSAQAGSFTLAQYNTATYNCGHAIGVGLKAIDVNFQLFFLNGYFQYWAYLQTNADTLPFQQTNPQGLLRPFMDGLYDAFGLSYTGGIKTMIVGSEDTFSCLTQACVDSEMVLSTGYQPPGVTTPYVNVYRFKGQSIYFDIITRYAPGVWLSYNESGVPFFDNNSPTTNFHTPSNTAQAIEYMLPYASYIWFFAQNVGMFKPYPTRIPAVVQVNKEYTDAIARIVPLPRNTRRVPQ